MRLPNDITANPSKFWPFVLADFGFGGLSGVLLAMGEYKWAGLVILLGIPPNLYFAFPALFNPGYAIRKGYLLPGSETVWPRNAGLLIFLAHGTHDPIVAIDRAHASREILRALDYPVTSREYPMEHEVCAQEVADLNRWLLEVLQ